MMRLSILALLLSIIVVAAEEKEEKEPPFRPFPEMPEVLFFDGYEAGGHSASKGGVSDEQAEAPSRKSLKFASYYQTGMHCTGSFGRSKFPENLNPNQVFIQFSIWSSDQGKINVYFTNSKAGVYTDAHQYQKEKKWQTVTFKLTDLRLNNKPVPADTLMSSYEIRFTPRGGEAPTVYMDNFCITANSRPELYMGKIAAMQGKTADIVRSGSKEGFNYTQQGNDALKAALKSARGAKRRPNTVLVIGGKPGEGEAVVKALQAAGPKAKVSGYTFVAAVSPDQSAVGGLEDVRTLLPYNLRKAEPEFVLMVFSNADGSAAGRNYDAVKASLERALEQGIIPIVIPPPPGGKADSFIGGVMRYCGELGAPCVDTGSVIKPVKDSMDGAELAAPGLEAVCITALQAIKHTEANVKK